MKNVYIINGGAAYTRLFTALGFGITVHIGNADLLIFTGGEDVSPNLYGDTRHRATGNNPRRDTMEKEYFDLCVARQIPMVGICRGGQFLNVMSGGRMYQHVYKHVNDHEITDLQTGEVVYVSSTHHQMIMPSPRGLLVAASYLHGEREWYDGEIFQRDVSQQDNEVVWYEHTKALCFQPHPEFMYGGMTKYFESLLKRFHGELYA